MPTNNVTLYIKEHSVTKLKYFGKTTKEESLNKYKGSGVYWRKHLKKHGSCVNTIWSNTFNTVADAEEFALLFSELFNIKTSNDWANLIDENAKDGAPRGVCNGGPFGAQNGMYGKRGILNPFYGKTHTQEVKDKISNSNRGSKNGNYRAKSFTEETYIKLRTPKPSKVNYKGTLGKITCINKNGTAVQISTELYNSQKYNQLPMSAWEYVNTRSNEATSRRIQNDYHRTI